MLAAPFLLVARARARAARSPQIDARADGRARSARSRATRSRSSSRSRRTASSGSSCCSSCRTALDARRRPRPGRAARRGEPRDARLRVAADALGRVTRRPRLPAATQTASGCSSTRRRSTARRRCSVYPTERGGAASPAPARDAGVRRQPGRPRRRARGSSSPTCAQFVPGDRIRHVNWRASARRGELWVNEYHAERNADVVIFLDSFAEARRGGRSTLDPAAARGGEPRRRVTSRAKDRVGFVAFGGMLNWLLPCDRHAQLYRIVDAMLDTQIILNYAWKEIDVMPQRTLPPQALVLALTPLLDERSSDALLDLRGARLRPRRDRDLAGWRSSAARGRGRAAGGAVVAAAARGRARAVRAGRSSDRGLGRRAVARGSARGGELVPTQRALARV